LPDWISALTTSASASKPVELRLREKPLCLQNLVADYECVSHSFFLRTRKYPRFSSLATSVQSYFDRRFKVAFRQTPNQIRSSINPKGAGTIKPTVA
jgi:hypothetical protein